MSDVYYAGLLVRATPHAWEETLAVLGRIPDVEVHQHDVQTGRIVVTVESLDLDRQTTVLEEIRALDAVLLAEPVYAYSSTPGSSETP